ncbi:HD family phosphohydrolase [Leptolyngbya sp. NIES-2104]|uniref:HD family phosphohydrolase n=1 Tax=Leptolyngbya sp. NIES-2104 TaxID=1552121 RepID=UPI0006EC50FE|nr:HDIG domain-containing metalloprotein [Leptolyngbya sp. NIES-2104]GAP99265.1 membrane protein containing HD superfamily hydrolase domain [Leptolyngbya sp. NIES-2104]
MNSLRSWAQQLQRMCSEGGSHLRHSASVRSLQRVKALQKLTHKPTVPAPVLIVAASIVLTGALGRQFYNQPRLSVGKMATDTITAPNNATIVNKEATEEKRKAARNISVPMFMLDMVASDQARQAVQAQLAKGGTLRQQIGKFPYIETETLSESTQLYLRNAEEWEWKAIVTALQNRSTDPLDKLVDPLQRKAAEELMRYRNQTSFDGVSGLTNQITAARQKYAATIALTQPPYDPTLFEIPDAAWQKTQTEVMQVTDRMLAQGISPGINQAQLETAIALNLQSATPSESRAIATKLLLTSLKPNLVKDEEQTRLQAEKAAQEVQPVIIQVRRGEVIVKEGQEISASNFMVLDYFGLSRRETSWFSLIGFGGLISGAVTLFWLFEQRYHPKGLRNRDYWLIGLMSLSTPLMVIINAPSTNLPAIGFLMGTFYGSVLAMTAVGLITVMLPIGMGLSLMQWVPSAIAGLIVAALAARVRSREELAFLGVGVGLIQGLLYLLFGAMSGVVWYSLLGRAVLEALLGLAWSIVAIGISPYLEHLFDVVTTLRLVELANPNRALLKRLAAETPGTFQHTLFVANLAETAARELGCNVELTRTGTLYHDIGKMHDPLGFIENQMGGANKHDAIADPWISAAIIKKHVTEGIVMARRARLPKAVQAFIPEHQGTMTIAYFYHQAQQRVKADSSIIVDESDFRYDGPAPQSRETGIVMLADACEAALRSLKDATPEEALNMINKILAARWKDGQLDESGLTRSQMSTIAQVFVQVWQQSNHQRIVYPKGKS